MQVCMSLRLLCHDLSAGSSTKQHSTCIFFCSVLFVWFSIFILSFSSSYRRP